MQQTDSTIIFWVFIGIGIAIFLFLLILSIRANWKRAAFFFALLGALALLVVGANFFPFILLTIIAGLLFAFSFATLATSWNWLTTKLRIVEGRLLQIWNPRKAYGGAIFGDIANAVGVFAGMGASRLFEDAIWWWIGQMAVTLALAVGLSLLWRSFRERLNAPYNSLLSDDNQTQAFKDANSKKHAAVFNFLVGAATWLSIMLVTESNVNQVKREDIRWLWIVLSGLLIIYLIILTVYFFREDHLKGTGKFRTGDGIVLVCFWAAVLAITGISIALRADADSITASSATEISGVVIGMVGILLWIIAEGQSWLMLSLQWNREGFDSVEALDYLVWEKNLWEMVGGLTTLVFLSTVLADAVNGRSSSGGLQSVDAYRIIFIVGATLGLFGTIRGILSGVLNKFQG